MIYGTKYIAIRFTWILILTGLLQKTCAGWLQRMHTFLFGSWAWTFSNAWSRRNMLWRNMPFFHLCWVLSAFCCIQFLHWMLSASQTCSGLTSWHQNDFGRLIEKIPLVLKMVSQSSSMPWFFKCCRTSSSFCIMCYQMG